MPRRLLHIPRHALRLLAAVVLVGGLLYVTLTRTQVGRDGLRDQIERQFARNFEGRVEIGRLTGNLVNDLFASDVRLLDAEGRVVLRVDSVVARPSWRSLFRRRVEVGALTLVRPRFDLVYAADGSWNLGGVFRRRLPQEAREAAPWTVDAADLRVIDGTIRTTRAGAAPRIVADGWLFDYTETRLDGLDLRATLEWRPGLRLIDVQNLRAQLPDLGLDLAVTSGQLSIEPERLLVSELDARLGTTTLRLTAALEGRAALAEGALDDVRLDLDLAESRLVNGELRRLVPRWPLADALTARARLAGSLGDVAVEAFAVARGRSAVRAEGRLRGLPDSLALDLVVPPSTIAAADLRALLPGHALPALDHLGQVRIELDGQAVAPTLDGPLRFRAIGDVDVRAAAGAVRGAISVRQRPGAPLGYALTLDADSVDLGQLLQRPALASRLTGRLQVQGRGLDLDSLDTRLVADLRDATLAGRHADTLHLDATLARRRLSAAGFVRERGGHLSLTGVLDLGGPRPRYEAGLLARRLDVGPWLRLDSLETALDVQVTVEGVGFDLDEITSAAALRFEDSAVRWHGQTRAIPPHLTTLRLRPRDDPDGPRLALDGDLAALTLDAEAPRAVLTALGGLWGEALGEAARRRFALPYSPAALRPPAPVPAARQAEARQLLTAAGRDAVTLDAVLRVKRSEVLAAFVPALPALRTDAALRFRLTADADSLHLDAHLDADSLGLADVRADSLAGRLTGAVRLAPALDQTLRLDLDLGAAALTAAGQTLAAPRLHLTLDRGAGRLDLATDEHGGLGPVRLDALLALLPDRTRLTLRDASLAVGSYVWTPPSAQPIDLFADAVVVPDLVLESRPDSAAAPQRLRFRGTLSAAPEDTFFVDVEALGLRQLSEVAGLRYRLGGRLDGELALTRLDRPELTGVLEIDRLAFEDRLLGRLHVESRYVPGLADVALAVTLRSAPPADDGLRPARNNVQLDGTFRLPAGDDEGALDLHLAAGRLDAFFFEYLFTGTIDDVRGGLAGEGTIGGSFRRPRFDGAFRLADGRFDVPTFNLQYAIDGAVDVDDEGFKLRDLRLEDATGGTATISGGVLFNDYQFFSFDLEGTLDELQIIDVATSRDLAFYGHIWASGPATLTGPLSNAFLRADDVTTAPQSEVFIPIAEAETFTDPGFIVFADSTGRVERAALSRQRTNILARRAAGERTFLDGLEMDLTLFAPQGSTVHLVIDPLLGDVINAVGSGRIQIQRREGDFFMFGALDVEAGDYLFTAGEVFVRRFLIEEGTIAWDGDPLDARLDLDAAYRTRASRTGLPEEFAGRLQAFLPVIVHLDITGRVTTPLVALRLAIDRSRQETLSNTQFLESYLNQPDRAAQLATSVLLTNSFLLAAEADQGTFVAGSAFTSVSQLVSSQLNRYLNQVLPNADFQLGLQSDASAQDLDLTAGLALRLLNERLVIRGQGVYRGLSADDAASAAQQSLQGEFVVEIRLTPAVSVEVFYRREGDVLSETFLTSSTGAGLSYQTQFPTWRRLFQRLFGPADAPAETPAAATSE